MATGIVKLFDVSKGSGFITPDDGTVDILVEDRNILGIDDKFLSEGTRVNFEVVYGQKGLHAIKALPL